jgi:hypothetical protein
MHVAVQVRVLAEDGKADISVVDRWGATPLDEAIRVGAKPVAQYLQSLGAPVGKEDDRIMAFLYAASRGDTATVRHVRPM